MRGVDLAAVDSASTQLARATRLQERTLQQVCDADLPRPAREHAQKLHDTASRAREQLQRLYHDAQQAA